MDTGAPAIEKTTAAPESSETDELKKNILAAYKDGAGISELSKKFHVSSDQVSLILRMAQREYGKK
jgi:Mor family transcriptional regulator